MILIAYLVGLVAVGAHAHNRIKHDSLRSLSFFNYQKVNLAFDVFAIVIWPVTLTLMVTRRFWENTAIYNSRFL